MRVLSRVLGDGLVSNDHTVTLFSELIIGWISTFPQVVTVTIVDLETTTLVLKRKYPQTTLVVELERHCNEGGVRLVSDPRMGSGIG